MSALLNVTVRDQLSQVLEDVRVGVWTTGGALVTQADTSALGVAEFTLNDGTYIVRLSYALAPYTAPTGYSVTMAGTNRSVALALEVLSHPASQNPNFCLCSGSVYNTDQVASFTLRLQSPRVHRANTDVLAFAPRDERLTLDSGGYGSFLLLRKGEYSVAYPGLQGWKARVPDLSAASLPAVLFPTVKSVVPESAVVVVAAGAIAEVGYGELYMSGLALDSDALALGQSLVRQFDAATGDTSVIFTSSDEDVATVADNGLGTLSIRGVSGGTATVSVRVRPLWADDADLEEEEIITITVS